MLHISKVIDNAKEIKSQIGSKTHDLKVVEYYKKLSDGIDLYPKTENINNILSLEIDYWELLLEKGELRDVDKKRFTKLDLPICVNIAKINNLISNILYNSNNSATEEHSSKEIESLSFAKALLFYMSNLWFIKEHKNTYDWANEDFKLEIKTIPKNLNFIKDYIKEIGSLDFDEMCLRYSKVVSNVKKTEYIQEEIKEYSIILNSHISSKDWEYIDKHFVWSIVGLRPENFVIEDIRNIHDLLIEGNFYSVIFNFKIGVELATLLLTTEMYVEFLQSQISNTKSLSSAKVKASLPDNSFRVDVERHEKYEGKKGFIENLLINSDLKYMMESLIKYKYIDESTKKNKFTSVFLGKEIQEKIKWIGGRNHLRYFISEMYSKKLEKIKSDYIWKAASKCFDIGADEKQFSNLVRKAEDKISDKDEKQLNMCIKHLDSIKNK